MPVSRYNHSLEIKNEIIEKLTDENNFLFNQIKKMRAENDIFISLSELEQKYSIGLKDDTQRVRYFFHFVAIQAYENNTTLIEMLQSDSEVKDIPLIKKGIGNLQEGFKRFFGFYTYNKDGSLNDTMIKNSLIYPFQERAKVEYNPLYLQVDKMIDGFRTKLETKNIKEIRCDFTHYQNEKGVFNPFNFTETALSMDSSEVYDLLFDYCIFLRHISMYVQNLMNIGYR
ncbi:MAG: hypothetical protein SNJ31_06875 [Rikenellaceae bacterium]